MESQKEVASKAPLPANEASNNPSANLTSNDWMQQLTTLKILTDSDWPPSVAAPFCLANPTPNPYIYSFYGHPLNSASPSVATTSSLNPQPPTVSSPSPNPPVNSLNPTPSSPISKAGEFADILFDKYFEWLVEKRPHQADVIRKAKLALR
ncbi:hypothetical protein VTO42DRAFT_4234 [Malbranchea cinnamomea]